MNAESFLKMDVFFLLTSVVVVALGIILSLILWYVLRIVRDIRDITDMVKKEAHDIAEDFSAVRTDVREGVHVVRENLTDGIATAKTYGKAVAGAGIVKALSQLLDAFSEEKQKRPRRARSSAKKKTE